MAGYGLETQIDSVTGEEREQWGSRSEFIFCLMVCVLCIDALLTTCTLYDSYNDSYNVPYSHWSSSVQPAPFDEFCAPFPLRMSERL